MRRFRFTLMSICLVLLYLGGSDLLLWFRNPAPLATDMRSLEQSGPARDWLQIADGWLDLDRAISTSGTIELEALLVPLLADPEQEQIHVLLETRDADLLELFKQYHLQTDTIPEKQAFRAKHAARFKDRRQVTGMLVSGLIARNNHQKLLELARETGLDVSDRVVFVSEGKEPDRGRGVFFTLIGLIGLIKVAWTRRQPPQ